MSNSLWSTPKNIGINLVPIRPSNPLLHPSVHDYPIKKNVFSFTRNPYEFLVLPRVWAKRKREKKRYTLAEPCYYSLSRSRLFRNCRVALLLCLFAVELKAFFVCFDWFCFLMLSSAFILFIIIPHLICMHARFFFFFFDERLVIHPATHSFVVHNYTTYLTFYLIYMQDMCNMRLWLDTQI